MRRKGDGEGGGALNHTLCVDQYQRLSSKMSATRKSTRRSNKGLNCCAQCLSLGGACSLEQDELGLGHQQRARNHLIHMLIPYRIYVASIDELVLILEDAERVATSTVIVPRKIEALVL